MRPEGFKLLVLVCEEANQEEVANRAKEANQEEVANRVGVVIGKGGSGSAILQEVAANACPGERLQSREQNERNLAEYSYTQEKSREEEEKDREEIPHGRSLLGQLTPKYRVVEHRKSEESVIRSDESESSRTARWRALRRRNLFIMACSLMECSFLQQ
jgi:hypothetical protein